MADRTLYIAAYDISSTKRLRLMLKVLKGYATGGQKSVFECFLTDGERRRLLCEVDSVMDEQEDSFLLVSLDPRSRVETLGVALEPVDPPFYYAG